MLAAAAFLMVAVTFIHRATDVFMSAATAYSDEMSTANWRCVEDATPSAAAATASSSYTNGWTTLRISTISKSNTSTDALEQAFAAGCGEAKLTSTLIYQYWHNYALSEYGSLITPPAVATFVAEQHAYVRAEVASRSLLSSLDPFWTGVARSLAQFDGLAAGFVQFVANATMKELMTKETLYLLNAVGDLETIQGLPFKTGVQSSSAKPSQWTLDHLDCSSLVRFVADDAGNLVDVFAGQTTWRSYYAMLRVFKVYDFSFAVQSPISISSSPGLLHSKDDFYATPQLVVMETTNFVGNDSMTEWVLHHANRSVLSWQRAMVATTTATSGKEWTTLFSRENSGTYNNQWIVVDFSTFKIHHPLPKKDAVWIAEQVPGLVLSRDVTHDITSIFHQYWPSFNVPNQREIFEISGYGPAAQWDNASNPGSYTGAPRYKIFKRDAQKVRTVQDHKDIMRYNRFRTDPICALPMYGTDGPSGSCAVSARGDLIAPAPQAASSSQQQSGEGTSRKASPFGGVDAKVIALTEQRGGGEVVVNIVNGPSWDDEPVFDWSEFPTVPSLGLPRKYDFEWVKLSSRDSTTHHQ